MNQPPFNDGLFGPDSVIRSTAWRTWLSGLFSPPLVLQSKPLLSPLKLGALEWFDDGTTGHLYITQNVAGVLTRVLIV